MFISSCIYILHSIIDQIRIYEDRMNILNQKQIMNQQIMNQKQIESLIKIGSIEAIFIMMNNTENIIECIYCMDIIYRLTKHNENMI